ncbi:hypothetical protein L6452_39863 [Arctium lappa]|uniref:Uncharacterized protein n=1 Tax=Arctium lappa TaxID=4217 RepID=A0ACB8XTF5_ARCLA|nr:hypothetical protein L6452_39863 [Arctium lappa]
MGISIAKHRLEILKLTRGSRSRSGGAGVGSHPMAKLILAIKKTKRSLAGYVRTWVHRRRHDSAALVMVQKRRSYSSRWKGAMLKRNNRLVTAATAAEKRGGSGGDTLLLTSGQRRRPVVVRSGGAKVNSFSSPLVYNLYRYHDDRDKADDGGDGREINSFTDDDDGGSDDGGGGGYWSSTGGEEIKWQAMFQNLKPT